jgi:hypothetical protein
MRRLSACVLFPPSGGAVCGPSPWRFFSSDLIRKPITHVKAAVLALPFRRRAARTLAFLFKSLR